MHNFNCKIFNLMVHLILCVDIEKSYLYLILSFVVFKINITQEPVFTISPSTYGSFYIQYLVFTHTVPIYYYTVHIMYEKLYIQHISRQDLCLKVPKCEILMSWIFMIFLS